VDEVTLIRRTGEGGPTGVLCTRSATRAILRKIAPAWSGGLLTDVASPRRGGPAGERLLPAKARSVGSPMAGSEDGVEFARADVRGACASDTTRKTARPPSGGSRNSGRRSGPDDSHGPQAARHAAGRSAPAPRRATLGESLAGRGAIDVAGPGFADVTRVASGDPDMWADILRTNRAAMIRSIDRLMAELEKLRRRLDQEDSDALRAWLAAGKQTRDEWVAHRYRKKVLPP